MQLRLLVKINKKYLENVALSRGFLSPDAKKPKAKFLVHDKYFWWQLISVISDYLKF